LKEKPEHSTLVSIIIATYNRSQLLYYAIQSIRQSHYNHWELIVIGDSCTDNTEAVVRSFGDDRISFVNLPENSGQQAIPNNHGTKLAKGEFVAFLNHDDMYLPSHLSNCMEIIEAENCDMICCPYVSILPSTPVELQDGTFRCKLMGFHINNKFSPHVFQVASSWFLRKEVIDKVGPWKHEDRLFVTPSQEWLFRAHQKGVTMYFSDKVGVFTCFSGLRRGSYRSEDPYEHKYFFAGLKDPSFVARVIEKAGLHVYGETVDEKYNKAFKHLGFAFLIPVFRVIGKLYWHPQAILKLLRFGGKGGYIRDHRRYTTRKEVNSRFHK